MYRASVVHGTLDYKYWKEGILAKIAIIHDSNIGCILHTDIHSLIKLISSIAQSFEIPCFPCRTLTFICHKGGSSLSQQPVLSSQQSPKYVIVCISTHVT